MPNSKLPANRRASSTATPTVAGFEADLLAREHTDNHIRPHQALGSLVTDILNQYTLSTFIRGERTMGPPKLEI